MSSNLRRPTGRGVRAVLVGTALVLLMIGVAAAGSSADPPPGVTVTASPRWGEASPGSWASYSVTVGNNGGADLEGEVVLAPQPEVVKLGAPQGPPESAPSTVLAVGGRGLTAPPLRRLGLGVGVPPWPSYRLPISVPLGSEKTLTVTVLQAPFGFGVELVGQGGRVLARSPGHVPAPALHENVLLLSDVPGAGAQMKSLPQQVAGILEVTQLRAARDFPDVALDLAGLDAVVVDDFDSGALSPPQRRALQDYVSLGGSLVVTGGAAWSRTLRSLPPGLAPLAASGSRPSPMGPLADLWGGASAATAEVVTGEVTAGRAVLAAPGGPPLVVTAGYHQGRVVQLAYDPLADPIASDPSLYGVAWDQALARVAPRWGIAVPRPAAVAEDQLWGPALGLATRHWPAWPRWGVGLLVVYALLIGPAAWIVSRRFGPPAGGVTVLLAVVVAAAASATIARPGHRSLASVVEVRTLGADGTVLTTSYRGVLDLRPPSGAAGGTGAASTVFAAGPVFGQQQGYVDGRLHHLVRTLPDLPAPPVVRGAGGGAVVKRGGRPVVRLPARAWALRTVQTVSIGQGGPGLEATLRRTGATSATPGRLQGTVTNVGPTPIRRLRAHIADPDAVAMADLAEVLAPGQTSPVDAAIVPVDRVGPGPSPVAPEETVTFAAASLAITGPGQVAVAGVSDAPPGAAGDRRRLGVVVNVGPLANDSLLRSGGRAQLVSASPISAPWSVEVADLEAPPRAGPLSIRYLLASKLPARPNLPHPPYEVYSWTTGTWRALPSERPGFSSITTPLRPAEVNEGLVRFRARRLTIEPIGAASSTLVPTGGGEPETSG